MSGTTKDLKMGDKFGKLTVLHKTKDDNPTPHAYYECICECGKKHKVRGALLRDGTTTRCPTCANMSMAAKKKGVAVGGPQGVGKVAPTTTREPKEVAADLLILAIKLTSRHSDAKPLWSDGPRSLYHGDCREILPNLRADWFDTIVTDPPFGEGKVLGDESPEQSAELLSGAMSACFPLLRAGGHVVVFSSSRGLHHTMQAVMGAGFEFRRMLSMHVKQGNARPWRGWLLRTQPIIIARKPGRHVPAWREAVAETIREAIDAKGLSKPQVAEALGVSLRLVHKWCKERDHAWSYPSDEHRSALSKMLDIEIPEQPAGDAESPECRHDVYEVSGLRDDNDHPCPKPLWVIEDIMNRLPGRILDPFAGSGTVFEAAMNLGLECTGVELDGDYCNSTVKRLARSAHRSFEPAAG